MDAPAQAAAPEVEYSVEVDTHRVRRPLGAIFWIAMLVLPLALTAVVGLTHGQSIQDALKADGEAALSKAGVHGVTLVMHGRSVTAEVPTGRDPNEVQDDLSALATVGILDNADDGWFVFPYDEIHVDFFLKAA